MIALVALLRVVPYALAGLLAWQKGYKRLTAATAYVVCVAVTTFIFEPSRDVSVALASVFSLLIFWHAADIESRKQ